MKFVLASAFVVALATLAPFSGYAAQKGGEESADIAKVLPGLDAALNKQLRSQIETGSNIKVDTSRGVVTLSGTAKNKAEADKAVAAAKSTPSIKSVQNDIKISGK